MKLIHIGVGKVFQNLDKEKNSSEFFESGRVIRPEPRVERIRIPRGGNK
jgi:hypothetical protein